MDLFGLKEHDERHAVVEQKLRRLIEQVAELSIDLSVTRTDLRRLQLEVQGKVGEADVDPSLIALDAGIKKARTKLAAAKEAADASWAEASGELDAAVSGLRESLDEPGD